MLHIPRFARLLLVALFLVVVPSVYFFYPTESYGSHITDGLDAGGIDSEHLRAKVPPPAHKPAPAEQDWDQWGAQAQALAKQKEDKGRKVYDSIRVAADPNHQNQLAKDGEDDDEPEHDAANPGAKFVAPTDILTGGVIMPHLGNATAKAELGRATWRFLHTMTLRFPDKPTPEDREALKSFFLLFSRLYPCGECAAHFQKMLKEYPPQTSSRKTASLWLCHLHNIVNERLHKPEFDCLTLDKTYDCGCGNTTSSAVEGAKNTAAV